MWAVPEVIHFDNLMNNKKPPCQYVLFLFVRVNYGQPNWTVDKGEAP
jgi:hypothetical protein